MDENQKTKDTTKQDERNGAANSLVGDAVEGRADEEQGVSWISVVSGWLAAGGVDY